MESCTKALILNIALWNSSGISGLGFILFYFILFYFILFYFISFHFISFHFISFHFIILSFPPKVACLSLLDAPCLVTATSALN